MPMSGCPTKSFHGVAAVRHRAIERYEPALVERALDRLMVAHRSRLTGAGDDDSTTTGETLVEPHDRAAAAPVRTTA